jgi:putative RNA 2'-phosphotransferase
VTKPSDEQLSRVVSHALRHEPWVYELELDDAGWVPVTELLDALHTLGPAWGPLDREDLTRMIEISGKRRHELVGERIRALYGHSVPGRLLRREEAPPETLFHGTSPRAWVRIQVQGLEPMRRQHVHLSVDAATAVAVGRRKTRHPLLVRVEAGEAHRAGIRFYRGNDLVWLADAVPPGFLDLAPDQPVAQTGPDSEHDRRP